MYLGSWKIDDYLTFGCNTHRFDTGAATDADSVPTYRIYEDETAGAIITGSTALLDSVNTAGFYSERVQLTAASGLEKGKTYTIYISATVNSIEGTMSHTFQIEAEVDANIVSDKTGFGLAADQSGVTVGTVSTLTGHTAQTGDSFARLGAPAAASIAADLLAIDNFVDELETRLSAARAGYLDNLSVGAVALASGVDLTSIHGVALTETVNGYLATAFTKLFDVATPLLVSSEVMRGTEGAYTGTPPTAAAIVNEWESQSQTDPTGFHVNVKEVNGTAQTANDNSADINSILTDTAEIGVAGAGLTDLGGMSTGMKAEVESEANDALIALNLDHLMKIATGGADMTAEVVDNTVLSRILANGDTSVFAPSTDGLQPIRDQGDSAWITATGFSTHSAADIWAVVTRALTDKSDFALSSTGADLILKDSTFALALADAVADEELTGATHNVANSLGRRIREIGAYAIESGTAQAGNGYSITLAATASVTDGLYNRNLIVLTDNTGVGQTRTIVDYNGTTKVAVLDREWKITPDATTVYQITADDTPLVVDHGLAQAGAASTITLRSIASAINDTYCAGVIAIVAGTGKGQSRLITGYVGSTKVATITPNWVTNPDSTSVYIVMPYGCSCVGNIGTAALAQINTEMDSVLDTAIPGSPTAHSINQRIKAVDELTEGSGSGDLAAIKTKTDNLPDGIKKNTAYTAYTFLMVDSTDHVTAKTGLTIAGSYTGDGGTVASLTNTGAITEISNGLYEIDLTAGELNYNNVHLIFTASGADARVIGIHTST